MPDAQTKHPMDELLRTRLRLGPETVAPVVALRLVMRAVDAVTRGLSGQPFFALREAEEVLRDLGSRTGPALIEHLLARNGGTALTAHGLDHVPATGGVVIGSTHPVGTFDFLAHAGVLLTHRPDFKVVANREAERFLGADRIIAVDLARNAKVVGARQTRADMADHLAGGGALLVFGSGKVPGEEGGRLVEPPWRAGITKVSAEVGVPVVPASPAMRNSPQYYRTRRLFRALSGGNDSFGRDVASLRYVSELLAKLGGSYALHYGPPVAPGTAPDTLQALAEGLVPGLYRPR